MSAEKKLKELGIPLAKPTPPVANYVNAVQTGNLLYLAGKGPGAVAGKVGAEISVEQG
jgi:enamine deaminase RidA (YjgF/YER057c/UK114 family)